MLLRRSQRQLNQQMRDVVKEGKTDVPRGVLRIVKLGDQLTRLMQMIESMVHMDGGSDFGPHRATLDALEAEHARFLETFPGMLHIRQCKDLYRVALVRMRQCRFLIEMVEQLPPERLSGPVCNALPAWTPGSDEVCAICCDATEDPWVKLPCGHTFHRGCAAEWLTNYKAQCPMCRQSIT